MSVPPTMEGVKSTVLTPLVASTAAVLQDIYTYNWPCF